MLAFERDFLVGDEYDSSLPSLLSLLECLFTGVIGRLAASGSLTGTFLFRADLCDISDGGSFNGEELNSGAKTASTDSGANFP